jgi:hypothetical protein
VIFDLFGQDDESVHIGRRPGGAITAVLGVGTLTEARAASAVDGAARLSAAGMLAARNFRHCASAWGNDSTLVTSVKPCSLVRHERKVDVQHHLSLDQEVEVEDQAVECDRHRSLDAVLERDEPKIDTSAARTSSSTSVIVAKGWRSAGRVVGLTQQCLLGEGAGRPEVRQGGRRAGHTRAG